MDNGCVNAANRRELSMGDWFWLIVYVGTIACVVGLLVTDFRGLLRGDGVILNQFEAAAVAFWLLAYVCSLAKYAICIAFGRLRS